LNNLTQSHLLVPNFDMEEEPYGNRPRVLSNIGLGDDVRIWKGSIVYEVLYLVFKVKAIIDFVAGFLVVVAIFIKVPSGRYRIRHGCGV